MNTTGIILSIVLLIYSMVLSVLFQDQTSGLRISIGVLALNILLVLVILVWALRIRHFSLEDLGLAPSRLLPSTTVGFGIGFLFASIGVLPFLLVSPGPFGLDLLANRRENLILLVMIQAGVSVALVEELIFRGVLYCQLMCRCRASLTAILGTSAVYALWHVGFLHSNIKRLDDQVAIPLLLALAGGLFGLFLAGLVLGWLRWRTRHVAAPVIAHWFAAAVLVTLPLFGA